MGVELKVISARDNPLIGRREVAFEVEAPSTPSRAEIRRRLAEALNVDVEQVWVRRMLTKTGTHITVGEAHVYEDAEKALEFEPEHIIRRNRPPKEEDEAE